MIQNDANDKLKARKQPFQTVRHLYRKDVY